MNNKNDEIFGKLKNSGLNVDAIKKAAASGDSKALLSSLNESDRKKLNNILNDRTALENLLKNPAAQQLLKKLSGEK